MQFLIAKFNKKMKHYNSLANKHRPRKLQELMGQAYLVKILNQSFKNNKIANTYLFCGSYGVGKTSIARIIAKIVNCTQPQLEDEFITPCDNCQNCLASCSHPDVLEIDAASKTGVDDMRQIIELSEYVPILGKYKLFIIDEVHMLSKNAFNALLKIMEEPPPRVIFIFATTQEEKIPETIVSRCHRYSLRPIQQKEILSLLRNVAQAEGMSVEEDTLQVICSKAKGSARDAIMLLDQLVYCAGITKHEEVLKILGISSTQTALNLIEFILQNDSARAIALIEALHEDYTDFGHFTAVIVDTLLNLIKIKTIPGYEPSGGSEPYMRDGISSASLSSLSLILQTFNKQDVENNSLFDSFLNIQVVVLKAIYARSLDGAITQTNAGSYLNKSKFMEFLYTLIMDEEKKTHYFLMHECEIIEFNNQELKLATTKDDKQMVIKLQAALAKWSGREYRVEIMRVEHIECSLYNAIQTQVQKSDLWQTIKQNFSSAQIVDLIQE
ncbi:DNA polymerase III subunit gamma/tau [Rickettsiales endosymbiont of Paramecium tredecaurelia]|uniref:DNA polymerase III subunit gamma/tau n=1 Tax=Candidatus Sarmatiella mevalonica TaxID=2770581 RepID=UPI001923F8CD|nr:DNA polymerase III subunit gamma/tau [Candidatus Sarmatiella mevalonica]MBL3285313.1 DNA polymerase III subunit gamma/tau [Candidatus Sarmatiella mevalonica]